MKVKLERDLFSGVAHVEIDVVAVVRNQLVAGSENGEAQEHEGSDELGYNTQLNLYYHSFKFKICYCICLQI